jgi:hypothetical protein
LRIVAGTLESAIKGEKQIKKLPPRRRRTWTLSKALSALRSNLFIFVGTPSILGRKGLLGLPTGKLKGETRKSQGTAIAFGDFHLPWMSLFSPFPSDAYLPIKKGGKFGFIFVF